MIVPIKGIGFGPGTLRRLKNWNGLYAQLKREERNIHDVWDLALGHFKHSGQNMKATTMTIHGAHTNISQLDKERNFKRNPCSTRFYALTARRFRPNWAFFCCYKTDEVIMVISLLTMTISFVTNEKKTLLKRLAGLRLKFLP